MTAEIALVHVSFADAEEAERVGSQMIADRLAACVTIHSPCRSIYRWNDGVERAQEVPATFKTAVARVERLKTALAELHSYELPVMEVATVSVDAAAGNWVAASTH